jgi:sugar lactone lactonase YvrE
MHPARPFPKDPINQKTKPNERKETMKTPNHLTKIIAVAAVITAAALLRISASANPGDLYVTDNSYTDTSSIRIYTSDGTGSIFASGLLRPRGLAFDGSGNLLVVTLDTATLFDDQGQILKFAPDGTVTVVASHLETPEGLAFDGAGNLYFACGDVSHPTTGIITKITPQGAVSKFAVLGGGFRGHHQNFGVTFDGQGNLFVADNIAAAIYMITPARRISTFVSLPVPVGLAFDGAGNLYASDLGPDYDPNAPGGITKIAPDGTQTIVVSGLGQLRGLAFDPNGNLFVAGLTDNVIYKITPDGSVSVFATGLDGPQFLAVEPPVSP